MVSRSGERRQSAGLLRWIITQSDSWRHWARAAPVFGLLLVRGMGMGTGEERQRRESIRMSLHEDGMAFLNIGSCEATQVKYISGTNWPFKLKSSGRS